MNPPPLPYPAAYELAKQVKVKKPEKDDKTESEDE